MLHQQGAKLSLPELCLVCLSVVDSSHNLTDREAWTIDRGSDGQKNRTKQRHTCDSMLFRTFV